MITSNQTIRNSKSRLVRLSSEDLVQGTKGRFTIDLLSTGGIIDNIKGYMVHSMECPNVFDNIPYYANTLTVVKATGLVTIDIPIPTNYYYIDDLVTVLQLTINTAIGPDTVVVVKSGSSPTEKFQFTFTGDDYDLKLSSSIASKLGLTSDLTCLDGVATTLQSIPNLIGETAVYMHSRTLAPANLIEGSGSFSVVDKLNLNVPYGGTAYTNYGTEATRFKKYYPFESLKTIRQVKVTLRNRTGNILTLPDNFDFSCMLTVFYK